ncbi:MAG: SurA N-terminal domain-containing protein [Rhodospirillales bacterium]|jgi:peptidyl-prolyl cis-trans isomerase D|nr:SurA N-terminal domain-containing protein [Rhodospirillales bacterium]
MLEYIRQHTGSILIKVLFGLLILSFGAWGIGDMISGRVSVVKVATVGDVEITPDQLNQQFQRELERLRPLFGGSLDREQARAMGLVDGVLKEMVERTLFDLAARDLGVLIGDDLVSAAIRGNPSFRNNFGKFDRYVFDQTLRNSGLSEYAFIEMVRDEIGRGQLLQGLQQGGTVPAAILNPLYRRGAERRIAETLFIANDKAKGIKAAAEEELIAFHEKNAARFTAPEYRTLSVLTLLTDDLAREIAVPDERLAEAYEERRDEFSRPEKRRVLQMVLPDEAAAKDALGKLTEGRPFAEVAKDATGMDSETVALGLLSRDELGQLFPELVETVFSLSPDVAGGPVESPLGWHLVKVSEIEPGHVRTLDEVGGELRQEIAKELAIDDLFDLSNKLEDILGGGATLEEAASSLNLVLTRVPSIDATGRDPRGQAVNSLPPDPKVLDVAFETPETQESPLTEMGMDGYFIVRVDQITAPALRPLAEVRSEVAEAWKDERRAEKARQTAEQVLERLKGGADVTRVAGELGIEVVTTPPIDRAGDGAEGQMPRPLITALFGLGLGESTLAEAARGTYVARLKEVRPANPSADKDGLEAMRQQLTRAMRSDLLVQYAGALRERYSVTTDKRAAEQLF